LIESRVPSPIAGKRGLGAPSVITIGIEHRRPTAGIRGRVMVLLTTSTVELPAIGIAASGVRSRAGSRMPSMAAGRGVKPLGDARTIP